MVIHLLSIFTWQEQLLSITCLRQVIWYPALYIQLSVFHWVQKKKRKHQPWPFLFCQRLWYMCNLLKNPRIAERHTRLVKSNSLLIYCMLYTVHYSYHSVIAGTFQIYEVHLYCIGRSSALISNTSSLITQQTFCVVLCMDYECIRHLYYVWLQMCFRLKHIVHNGAKSEWNN